MKLFKRLERLLETGDTFSKQGKHSAQREEWPVYNRQKCSLDTSSFDPGSPLPNSLCSCRDITARGGRGWLERRAGSKLSVPRRWGADPNGGWTEAEAETKEEKGKKKEKASSAAAEGRGKAF